MKRPEYFCPLLLFQLKTRRPAGRVRNRILDLGRFPLSFNPSSAACMARAIRPTPVGPDFGPQGNSATLKCRSATPLQNQRSPFTVLDGRDLYANRLGLPLPRGEGRTLRLRASNVSVTRTWLALLLITARLFSLPSSVWLTESPGGPS